MVAIPVLLRAAIKYYKYIFSNTWGVVIPVLLRATGGERSKARHEEVKPVENYFTGLFKGLPGSSNHMN